MRVTSGKDQGRFVPVLADFAGRWSIGRRIEDRLARAEGRFDGEAVFAPDGHGGLTYRETGELRLGGGPAFTAERSYLWRETDGRIIVDFADGRPFHGFDPAAPAAHHLCIADDYTVRYVFAGWPEWQAEWTVCGPRKDYTMLSLYRRA
ncbi:MAG: DUF6314 family protein [Proteobacteria bacterium]|nr:DUF6314 family protein [Pseudomonadota bacterium]